MPKPRVVWKIERKGAKWFVCRSGRIIGKGLDTRDEAKAKLNNLKKPGGYIP